MLHFHEGRKLRTHNWDDREEQKSPAPGGIWTHDLSVMRHALYRCATTAAYTISIVGMDPMSSCTRWIRKLGHSNQLLTVTPCLKLLPSFIVAHLDRVCETGGHLRSGSEPGSLDEESCIFLVLSSGHRTSWSSRTSRGPTFRKFRIFFSKNTFKN